MLEEGKEIYHIAESIFPICRSITGNGVRKTLKILQDYFPALSIHEIPSGTKVFDWEIPEEWNIEDAYIQDEQGNKLIDFKKNNLYVMGYSLPLDKKMMLEELLDYIYTDPLQPSVVPYVTSYYQKRSGFCMSDSQKQLLKKGTYHAVIRSTLSTGSLTYGEIVIPGETKQEIFFSTYICHPSMANNECSGPSLAIYLAHWLFKQSNRKYTYRIIFIPETIGSIAYLSQNMKHLKKYMIAGFNLTCVGDNLEYSLVHSRYGNNIADKVLKNILSYHYPEYKEYSFLERGSDERQYCSPNVDLPLCGFSRSKFHTFPEYHTSADNMSFISPAGFQGSFDVITQCIMALENNEIYKVKILCEPQLGRRNLYPTISYKGSMNKVKILTDFLAYADGTNDLIDISNIIHSPIREIIPIISLLIESDLIERL